ncbi:RxLR effector candidate protein [Phytophthora cinnamomi]|uniref:RxLR effector candidate protein n=1 Tax=Phytophthora cinnamomi TaxID=4785 RepID=UPI00355A0F25|nr:RxLR effector candidate protein [Phytophthora cinnamomi]
MHFRAHVEHGAAHRIQRLEVLEVITQFLCVLCDEGSPDEELVAVVGGADLAPPNPRVQVVLAKTHVPLLPASTNVAADKLLSLLHVLLVHPALHYVGLVRLTQLTPAS